MTDTAIRVENLGKKYKLGTPKSGDFRESMSRLFRKPQAADRSPVPEKEFWALQDVSFEIKQGEAVGIIGRNGAGKSTLLKILSRITEPTQGRFEIFGRVSSLLEVGTGFHEELTGRENVFLNGTILGMRRQEIKAKFDEIVAFSGVEKFIDSPVKHYSSGMKVRLAFAVAAHLEPEILIIDEVLAVGDAEFQKKCLGKMEDVTGQGRTVLFVSHNMGAVQNLCTNGLLLENSTLVYKGKINLVLKEYLGTNLGKEEGFSERYYTGTGKVKFKFCEFITGDSFPSYHEGIPQIPFSSVLQLRLVLEADSKIDDQLYVAITILDQNGVRVSTLDNLFIEQPIKINDRQVDIACIINKVTLNPGIYYCDLWCSNKYDTFQKIEKALTFEVVFSDYLGTAKLHTSSKHGFFYLDQKWLQKQI